MKVCREGLACVCGVFVCVLVIVSLCVCYYDIDREMNSITMKVGREGLVHVCWCVCVGCVSVCVCYYDIDREMNSITMKVGRVGLVCVCACIRNRSVTTN
jgi:hypothetical protein